MKYFFRLFQKKKGITKILLWFSISFSFHWLRYKYKTLWMKIFRIILVSPIFLLSQLFGFEGIKIGTLHGQLRFDPEIIVVKKGADINLVFDNQDEMIHNLLIAKGDSKHIDQLAEKALALGEKGLDMGFIPKDDSIIASIGLVQPGEKAKVSLKAPNEGGDYPYVCTFPGHSLSMRGIMKVVDDPSIVKLDASKAIPPSGNLKNGVIEVGNTPRVVRVHFSGIDAGRSIAVGLPGGFNYLFDAESLHVRTGWTGGFINVNRDRRGRGGGLCSILGEQFTSGSGAFPVRIGDPDKIPETKFMGYSRSGNPTFHYEVDGVKIEQSTTGYPSSKGLTYNFKVAMQKEDIFFLFDPEKVQLASSTTGQVEKGRLKVQAKHADNFLISVINLTRS